MLSGTLCEALDEAAANHPETAAHFPAESVSRTLPALVAQSRVMAYALTARDVRPGDRVGILCANAPEFLDSLFAVARAGAAACPLATPLTLRGIDGYVDRLTRIAEAAEMRHLIISPRWRPLIPALRDRLPGVDVLPADTLREAEARPLPGVRDDDLAVVQFTSGSTALPKGVPLTHRNVLAGLTAIGEGIAIRPDDAGGFWIPLFHDMGLFGTLTGLLSGIPVHIWSPADFVKRPARWLREFAASGATISAMPNFGYEYLLDAVGPDEAAGYDLSRWRVAFNGAEPIRRDAVDGFLARFRAAGFRPGAMLCCYGLAEATLAVTLAPLGRGPVFDHVDRVALAAGQAVPAGPADGRAVAGCGRPVRGVRVRVADPDTGRPVPDGVVGEIRLQGDPVTAGYLGRPGEARGWLSTGDLGYLRAGELYVTGRRTEMIILRGQNIYPYDVEAVVQTVPGVHKRRCVAVADQAAERIVVLAETGLPDDQESALAAEIRRRIATDLGLSEVDVHLVGPSALPRTSSGKFRRAAALDLIRDHRPAA